MSEALQGACAGDRSIGFKEQQLLCRWAVLGEPDDMTSCVREMDAHSRGWGKRHGYPPEKDGCPSHHAQKVDAEHGCLLRQNDGAH
jgi:hypothetical protein